MMSKWQCNDDHHDYHDYDNICSANYNDDHHDYCDHLDNYGDEDEHDDDLEHDDHDGPGLR